MSLDKDLTHPVDADTAREHGPPQRRGCPMHAGRTVPGVAGTSVISGKCSAPTLGGSNGLVETTRAATALSRRASPVRTRCLTKRHEDALNSARGQGIERFKGRG